MGERCGCGSRPWVGGAKGKGSVWEEEEVASPVLELELEVATVVVEAEVLLSTLSALICLINLFFRVESFTT